MTSLTPEMVGLILGGLLPALIYGVSTIFAKAANLAGISPGYYLIIQGIGAAVTGILFLFVLPDRSINTKSFLLALSTGVVWAIGAGLIAVAIVRYNAPLGKLVPLYNMNTLVAVLLALWIFAEWQQVKVAQLIIGSVLIVVGGILVARA